MLTRYLVTLIHPRTEDEQLLDLVLTSDRFATIRAAVNAQRLTRGLKGYVISEVLQTDTPF